MKTFVAAVTTFLLFALLPARAPAEEPTAPISPSPVGLWRLDRDQIEPGINETADELLKSFLIPDMELRILEGDRYEAVVQRPGLGGEARLSIGTWTQSRDVLSLSSLRDDGQPASLIGRLQDEQLVIDLGNLELPFRRVVDPAAPAQPSPPAEKEETPPGSIGLGPGPSIKMPLREGEDESWPPVAITRSNHHRVAKRVGAEVVAALAAERECTVSELWQDVPATRVLHIQSSFDRIETILDAWQIPHTTLSPLAFLEQGAAALAEARVVLAPSLATLPRALESGLASVLRTFVAEGGYLATSNWSVESILQPAFPELVATEGRRAPMGAMLCIAWVTPAAGAEKSLLRGLPQEKGIPLWCETSSFDVQPLRGAATPTLLAANQPHLEYDRSRTVLCAAAHGKGKLLHTLPHVHQERGRPQGAHVLQRIVLNFVVEALAP